MTSLKWKKVIFYSNGANNFSSWECQYRDFQRLQVYYTQPFRSVKELPSGHSRKKSPLKMHYHFQVTNRCLQRNCCDGRQVKYLFYIFIYYFIYLYIIYLNIIYFVSNSLFNIYITYIKHTLYIFIIL